ncbi:MAG: glutamate synthase large subunit [Myxococcales bacterium]|nr:MAG: glutamate synthase large subunit [Myxococcales bacterium]
MVFMLGSIHGQRRRGALETVFEALFLYGRDNAFVGAAILMQGQRLAGDEFRSRAGNENRETKTSMNLQDISGRRYREIKAAAGKGGCGILAVADLTAPASKDLVDQALAGIARMEHRGGAIDGVGDGAGILLKPARKFFERFLTAGRRLSDPQEPLIVGMVYFSHGERNVLDLEREFNAIVRRHGLAPLGWRETPLETSALGRLAREDVPRIHQVLLAKGHRLESELFAVLHRLKVTIEAELAGFINIVSLAPYTTIYKLLGNAAQLAAFYPDFKDPEFTSTVVVAHRRFSTNTFSNWNLVQPFRHIAHNGEINTIVANCRAVRDAEAAITLGNTLMNHGSDSAQLDRVAEMMAANGMQGVHEALRRMIQPAWIEEPPSRRECRFFEANRRALGTVGAWEGPIALVGTDGRMLAGVLDRMGLRPLRYQFTRGGRLVISSEAGAVPLDPAEIAEDGQLEPGGMILADLHAGKLIPPEEATGWIIDRTGLNFENLATVGLQPIEAAMQVQGLPIRALNAFGWTKERVSFLQEMAKNGKEPVQSMGNDRPLAVFSENHSRLYSFFHQIVAVITNPPIDPIREGGAIDLTVFLGRSPQIGKESTYHSWPQYKLPHPVLSNEDLESLFASPGHDLKVCRLDATFPDTGESGALVRRIHELTQEAVRVIRQQRASLLVVSDYEAAKGRRLPLPMVLIVSAVHQALAANGLRRDASIVVETGEVHEGHDFAVLLAYGATAVNPYAMFHLARQSASCPPDKAVENVKQALASALRHIMSKMGITTVAGYRGSAPFEAVGIASDVVEYYIPDTYCRLGGIDIDDIYRDIVARFHQSEEALAKNQNASVYRREVTDALQRVARNGNAQGDYDRFVALLEETPPVYLRDMLDFHPGRPLPVDRVADEREIVRYALRGAAMSHGALNGIAHRAIAAAFNHFGSFSNCGEGGEDERRNPGGEWEQDRSRTRQIASGRFGVDAAYLAGADEIEIKIGQGAKPGEGGHLPGAKVTAEIARIRKTRAGVDLISPPPHHDIYSIEDLAQLIRNLRELNPAAAISVKAPSITNLGTIAVGVVKAGADVIAVSGFEGGTGAASSSSIAHAGLPIERGISEAHQVLTANRIRQRVRLRADGGIKSGLEAAKIIALGADEIAIGTPLLIAECCVFCRGCNKGNCPVGIATHDETKMAERFMRSRLDQDHAGESSPEDRYLEAKAGVIRFLECFAGHLRRLLAGFGLSHPRELVGRVDLLRQRTSGNARWDRLDLTELLLDFRRDTRSLPGKPETFRHPVSEKNRDIADNAASVLSGESNHAAVSLRLANSDHAVGATLAGKIARSRSISQTARVDIHCQGYAGQAFGFAATSGMALRLEGYANDAVAEALGGSARIVVVPPSELRMARTPHLVGNAAAYGATGGVLYVAGRAGQRFGVRNSGATLVCLGVGKYAFEYMTGGVGVVLGTSGPCLGSGMTGGELFLLDWQGQVQRRLHADVAGLAKPVGNDEAELLREILADFHRETGESTARRILDHFQEERAGFVHIKV